MKSLSLINIKQSWYKALFVGLVFISTEFCGSIELGGISIRNAVFCCLILYLYFNSSVSQIEIKGVKFLIAYYAFVAFLGLFNGFYEIGGFSFVLTRFVLTITLLFFLLTYIKTETEYRYSVYVIIFIMFLDALVTILQGINHPVGWWVASIFQSHETFGTTQEIIDVHSADTTVGLSIASGFCGSVVINGYLLGALALLLSLPIYWNFHTKTVICAVIVLLVFSLALFYNQQRMAFYVFHSAIIAIIITYAFLKKNYVLIALIIIFVVSFLVEFDFDKFISDDELGRLSSFDDTKRSMGRKVFWESFFPDNFLLGNRAKFIELYGTTPHNLPIEILLFGGIIGLAIFSLFVLSLCKSLFQSLLSKNFERFLIGTPIIALMIISLRHSSGFHTGLTLGAYMLSFFLLSFYKLKE